MAEKPDPEKEAVDYKVILLANMMEIQAVVQLLIRKGVISNFEYTEQLKRVNEEYQSRKAAQ
jgi:hypothetical protein